VGGDSQTVLGVVIALIGMVGAVLVARISSPARADPQAVTGRTDGPKPAGPDGLLVSPEIWRDLSGRITSLETEVHELKGVVEQGAARMAELDFLLRAALRIIRAQSRTLRRAGLPDEELPPALVPYSID
jgi:hypothetical protein